MRRPSSSITTFAERLLRGQYLSGSDRAYLSPSGAFVHVVTVAIRLPPAWKQIATGLEPVSGGATIAPS